MLEECWQEHYIASCRKIASGRSLIINWNFGIWYKSPFETVIDFMGDFRGFWAIFTYAYFLLLKFSEHI